MTGPIVVLDIETTATDAALALEPDESWLTAGIRDNFKPETVEKYRADNLAKWPAELARRASLDWRLGRIVAVGIRLYDAEQFCICDAMEETALLEAAWGILAPIKGPLVGFNIRNFDLPWLLGRTAANSLKAQRSWDARRYGGGNVIDWMDILSNYGSFSGSGWSLSRYAEWFQLGEPYGAGADVAGWWANQQYEEIQKHCMADLEITYAMHQQFAPAFLPRTA